ncbi:MAG: hypothetical protein KDC46_01760 [Thermoleophilia bacterium]|nr:hypothetical protein [Thermoleophilia bacterium]
MNANLVTAANYAVAAGVGVGAAAIASKVAPDSIAPGSDGERNAWLVAGGVGGAVTAMQIMPRVLPNQLDKAVKEFHTFDSATLHALARHEIPVGDVPGVMSTYLGHHNKIEQLTVLSASNGVAGGWATKAKFAGMAAAGAVAGVGLLMGGMWVADKIGGKD